MNRNQMMAEMGIKPVWRLRQAPSTVAETGHVPVEATPIESVAAVPPKHALIARMPVQDAYRAESPTEMLATAEAWASLADEVKNCRACKLCETRKQAVLGAGDLQAAWMLVGEGPGAEEDEHGEPFLGQAGKLLDAMLASVGMSREKGVYIANAVKCRPPGNRTPTEEEITACRPFLERQISMVGPKLLMALGRPAAQSLLVQEVSIEAARGKPFEYRKIPVVVTYHPAYLLRTPQDKAKAWEDLCRAKDSIN